MQELNLKIKNNQKILALGAELDTTLAYYHQGKVFVSDNLGESGNDFSVLEQKVIEFLDQQRGRGSDPLIPDCILTDLHPEYNSTKVGEKLAKQWEIPHLKVQHHHAHVFSSMVENYLLDDNFMPSEIISIACDGTGYGLDDTIWGGEMFSVEMRNFAFDTPPSPPCQGGIKRIGHLEHQTLIGGQLAVEEPARMLMSILAKFLDEQELYQIMDGFYEKNIFKLLNSQLNQNFNCLTTSSCARVLDAACALLFGCNERRFKHQAAKMLEDKAVNAEPYDDIEPIIITETQKHENTKTTEFSKQYSSTNLALKQEAGAGSVSPLTGGARGGNQAQDYEQTLILQTTPLFEYLVKNLDRDKNRLAATVHRYVADGLLKIVNTLQTTNHKLQTVTFSGGMANNKNFKSYLENHGVLINKKIPSGDPGISVGQIGWFLLLSREMRN